MVIFYSYVSLPEGKGILFNTGWWLTYPSEKYEFVRLDHHPVPIGANKIHVPNHQPGIITIINHH